MVASKISTLEISKTCAEMGFYVLFPGFFFYHLGVTGGFVPGVLGGLFGPVTVVLAVVFAFGALGITARYGRSRKPVLFGFFLLLLYCVGWFALHHYTTSLSYRDEAAEQILALLIAWFALFVGGAIFPVERARIPIVLAVSLSLIALTTLLLFDVETMMFNPRSLYEFTEGVATYQGYARSALLTALFLLGTCSSFLTEVVVGVASVLVLFLLGARSELFGFVALGGVLVMLETLKTTRRAVVVAVLMAVLGVFMANHMNDFMASRQSQILDIEHATSWQARREYLAIAFRQVSDHPLIGVYAGNFEAGGKGAYAHNAISAWVSFGFVGFSLYLGLTVYCAIISFRRFRRNSLSVTGWKLSFCVNFVALLLVVVAKPIFWAIPALGWGLVVNASRRDALYCQVPLMQRRR